jgi:hydroxyacylglutathione hydrolase
MIIEKFPSGPLAVNCYLVTDSKTNNAFILDPGGYSEKLIESVQKKGSTVLYIILTHGHSDHIGGVQDYVTKFNAQILAHKCESGLLNCAANNFSKEVFGKAIEFDADIYVDEDSVVKVGDLNLTFIHTPGHSPGGMCVLAEDNLFSGDTLFAESVGRTDFPYSSFKDLTESIHKKLFVLPDETKVYPGHMGETTIGHEKRFNPFV